MTTTPGTSTPFAQTMRITSGTYMGALVILGVVLFFTLGAGSAPPLWLLLAQIVAGAVVHVVVETIGYRPAPLAPSMSDDEVVSAGRTAWQTTMTLRFALIDVIAIVSLVVSYVIEGGGVSTYAIGALVSLVLLAIHVWPGSRPVGRTAGALEAQGRTSFLREEFGQPPQGPIQQF